MSIVIDYSRMFPVFDRQAVESYAKKIAGLHAGLEERRRRGELPFYDLPSQDVSSILRFARERKGRFDDIVVLGIGGSALGLISLDAALRSPYGWKENGPRLYVMDNIDPERFSSLLDRLDPARTTVNAITKSGSTAETMASFLILRKWLIDALGEDGYRERMFVTTDREKGALRKIAGQDRLVSFAVPDGVGGRFSVLTPVGLVPAALAGIDIEALLAGAAAMSAAVTKSELFENPAYLGAVFHHLGYQQGRRISVMFAYADRLVALADWYRQLWAESLGKRLDLDGAEVHAGPTPVKALGVTDQHSQLQLYKEGPDDKIFTFLRNGHFRASVAIPAAFPDLEAVSYLSSHTLEELLQAEEAATEAALIKAGRPVASVLFPEISAETVGAFFYWLEVQTVMAGALMRINPLDQPGVEEGKHFAYGLMGRRGYDTKRQEMKELESSPRDLVFG